MTEPQPLDPPIPEEDEAEIRRLDEEGSVCCPQCGDSWNVSVRDNTQDYTCNVCGWHWTPPAAAPHHP